MKKIGIINIFVLVAGLVFCGCGKSTSKAPITLQLNWLHDPTFAGEYLLAKQSDLLVSVREGGPNLTPIAEVLSGRASIAVVGADIFLQALEKDTKDGKKSQLVCFFVDFQRNPVGWVLHPEAASKAGLGTITNTSPRELNKWLFSKFADGTLKPGDKRGTETTSIWIQWKKVHNLSESVSVVPVGFDTAIVLSAPSLAYPVYLNEEPFKLSEKIGRDVVVFDPAVDGVELYGNVLVTTRQFAQENPNVIRSLQTGLRKAWQQAMADQSETAREVASVYKGVSDAVLQKQINKTVEYVSYGGREPGVMDTAPNGRWAKTLQSLQEAGIVAQTLTFDLLKEHLMPPQ